MDPRSTRLIGQILNPVPMGTAPAMSPPSTRMSVAEIVQPPHACGAYTGPERRAQGYLIAEVIEEAPASQSPSRI